MNRKGVVLLFAVLLLATAVLLLFCRDGTAEGNKYVAGNGENLKAGVSAAGSSHSPRSSSLSAKHGERPSLSKLAGQGMMVEADEIGDSLARGNVSVSFPGGGRLETEQIRLTAGGSLRTEGESVIHVDGGAIRFSGAASLLLNNEKGVSLRIDEGSTMYTPLENK